MAHLDLYLLGPPRFELDHISLDINRRKAVALLAYLALADPPQSRDSLATLLWPDYDQSRARAALRRTLSVLNTTLAGNWLVADRETVALDHQANLWIDVRVFRRTVAALQNEQSGRPLSAERLDDLSQAVALYRDDFLTGFTLRDSPDFDEWQFFQTESLRRDLAWALERLVHCYTVQGEPDLAIAPARRWLSLDPLNEPAHRALMDLYARTDQRAAALRQYQECVRLLAEELDLAPSAETTALYERIRTGEMERRSGQVQRRGDISPSPAQSQPVSTGASTSQPDFLVSLPLPARPSTPFVAREQELAQLRQYFEPILTGRSQIVFVTGEAGSGKTALARTFARQMQAELPDLTVAVGNCNAHIGPGDPYLPFREILDLLTGQIETGWRQGFLTEEEARRLWRLRPQTFQAILESGSALVNTFIPQATLAAFTAELDQGSEWLARLESAETRNGGSLDVVQSDLFDQYAAVIHTLASRQPLLLIIDDAQWADAASINLLFHLSRRLTGSRLMLILIYRPDEVALGRPAALSGDRDRHPLEPILNEIRRLYGNAQVDLSQHQDRQFIEALLDTQPNRLGSHFREALYQRTQGHPLFTVELLRDMQERGDLVQDEAGFWVEGPELNWEMLPGRVEAVIAERIYRLDESMRSALTVASVEGEAFTAQVIARVQAIPERQLLHGLSQMLEKRHHLVREQGEVQIGRRFLSRYQFSHTLFQQFLYNTLSTGERRLLHGDVAAALEELYDGHVEEITVRLARHYAEAGDIDKAVDFLLRAGDRARDLYAHQEAIDFYEQALAFLRMQGDYDRAARTLMKLGLTYHLAFDFRQARQAYQEGFSLWQRANAQPPAALPPAPHPFRRIWWTDPPTLDSTLAGDDTSGGIIYQLFSGLMALTPEMDAIPDIARSWDVLEDGRRYIFHLRPDVTWSDGEPVTANDFVYAWRRILNPATASPNADYLFDLKGARAFYEGALTDPEQVGVRALNPYQLAIELEEPTSYFPQMAARGQLFPIPRHVVERYGHAWTEPAHIVTNGPFTLVEWTRGEKMILRRNPNYRGQATGNVQQVVLWIGLSFETEVELYETNQLDALQPSPSPILGAVRHRFAADYFSGPNLHTQYIGFNAIRRPFNDLRVRRAFAMAVDKETLASIIFAGYFFPATGGFVPPGMPGYSPDIALPFNPEQARRLMAEAGYPEGRGFPEVEFLTKPRLGEVEYLLAQWQEHLGVKLKVTVLNWSDMLTRLEQNPPHLFRMGWAADYPDPDNFLRKGAHAREWLGWHNEAYEALMERARHSTSQTERLELYRQADKILVEEAIIAPMLYSQGHIMLKPWVRKHPTSAVNWHFWKDVVIEPH